MQWILDQEDPTNPDTYELPYETYDISQIKRVEDLPVWDKGCDSSYTWAKKYKHLMGQATPKELADKVVDILRNKSNPDGLFLPSSFTTTSTFVYYRW